MKIVYINKSMAQWGGVERVYCDKINYLSNKYGYNITLITYEQGNHPIPYHLDDKIKVIDLDVPFSPYINIMLFNDKYYSYKNCGY